MKKQDVINLLEKINPDAAKKLALIRTTDYFDRFVDDASEWLEHLFDCDDDWNYWEHVCNQIDEYNRATFSLWEVKSMLEKAFIAGANCQHTPVYLELMKESMEKAIKKILEGNL